MTWRAYKYEIKRTKLGETPAMQNAVHASEFFIPLFEGLEYEKMYVAALDTKRQLFALEEVSSGGLAGVSFFPRDVFRLACRANASAVVLAHNHPSGDLTPSALDIEATRTAIASGNLLGIRVVDHLIVHEKKIYSMRAQHTDLGWWTKKKVLDKKA